MEQLTSLLNLLFNHPQFGMGPGVILLLVLAGGFIIWRRRSGGKTVEEDKRPQWQQEIEEVFEILRGPATHRRRSKNAGKPGELNVFKYEHNYLYRRFGWERIIHDFACLIYTTLFYYEPNGKAKIKAQGSGELPWRNVANHYIQNRMDMLPKVKKFFKFQWPPELLEEIDAAFSYNDGKNAGVDMVGIVEVLWKAYQWALTEDEKKNIPVPPAAKKPAAAKQSGSPKGKETAAAT